MCATKKEVLDETKKLKITLLEKEKKNVSYEELINEQRNDKEYIVKYMTFIEVSEYLKNKEKNKIKWTKEKIKKCLGKKQLRTTDKEIMDKDDTGNMEFNSRLYIINNSRILLKWLPKVLINIIGEYLNDKRTVRDIYSISQIIAHIYYSVKIENMSKLVYDSNKKTIQTREVYVNLEPVLNEERVIKQKYINCRINRNTKENKMELLFCEDFVKLQFISESDYNEWIVGIKNSNRYHTNNKVIGHLISYLNTKEEINSYYKKLERWWHIFEDGNTRIPIIKQDIKEIITKVKDRKSKNEYTMIAIYYREWKLLFHRLYFMYIKATELNQVIQDFEFIHMQFKSM